MKHILLAAILLASTCDNPKKKSENTTNLKQDAVEQVEKKVVEKTETTADDIVVVLKNPKKIEECKSFLTNSGLTWKKMVFDNGTSKIGVIKAPKGKRDYWLKKLKTSNMFRTIKANETSTVDALILKEKNTLFSYHKTQCFGDCPTYEFSVDNDGNVTYNGIEYVNVKGIQEFKLTDKELETLKGILGKNDFTSYKDIYDNPRIKDLSSTFMTYNGKQVQIRLWKDIPKDLINLNEFVDGLLLSKKFFE